MLFFFISKLCDNIEMIFARLYDCVARVYFSKNFFAVAQNDVILRVLGITFLGVFANLALRQSYETNRSFWYFEFEWILLGLGFL